MIQPITQERWQQAQTAELATVIYDNPEVARRSYALTFDYLGMTFDQSGKVIAEIGCGAYPAVRFCEIGHGHVFEPLWFAQLKELTLNPRISWWMTALEDAEYLPNCDQVWLFNCLQHVRDPELVVAKCKEMAPVIRFFEPVDYPTCTYHPHTFTQDDFGRWFGDVKRYTDRLPGFFDADCCYGTYQCG